MSHFRKGIAALVLAVGSSLLVFSEASIKSIIEEWFTECKIVIHKKSTQESGDPNKSFVPVTIYSTGSLPDKLPIAFKTGTRVITKVILVRDISNGNLAVHPDSGLACPGNLCTEPQAEKNKELKEEDRIFKDIELNVVGVNGVFDMTFHAVVLDDKEEKFGEDDLEVYVHYSKPLPKNVCAVEESSLWNSLIWLSDFYRFIVLSLILVIITAVIAALSEVASRTGQRQ